MTTTGDTLGTVGVSTLTAAPQHSNTHLPCIVTVARWLKAALASSTGGGVRGRAMLVMVTYWSRARAQLHVMVTYFSCHHHHQQHIIIVIKSSSSTTFVPVANSRNPKPLLLCVSLSLTMTGCSTVLDHVQCSVDRVGRAAARGGGHVTHARGGWHLGYGLVGAESLNDNKG